MAAGCRIAGFGLCAPPSLLHRQVWLLDRPENRSGGSGSTESMAHGDAHVMVPIAQASAYSVTVPLGAIHVTALASMEGAEEAMQITDPAQPEIKEPTPAPAPIPELPPNPLLVKVTECWAAVTAANQASFPAWTELITSAEKLDQLDHLRAVYEPFLAAFPLCFGYWKKYADAEARHQNIEAALAVFERGVCATPYSLDLWGHYAQFRKVHGGATEDVRSIFDRGVAYCGSDYLGHTLWDKFLQFEEEQGTAANVAATYTRVLSQPLRELPRYMQSLTTFVHSRTPAEFIPAEELTLLTSQLASAKDQQAAAAREAAAAAEGDAEPPEPMDTVVTEEDIKAGWLSQRQTIMEHAKQVADSRKPYEDNIKRTYFHVKALDQAQLLNWISYLDFMEEQGDDSLGPTVIVYERCLVPCASYPEFWERYVRFLQSKGMKEEATGALQRATTVYCRTRPEIHVFAARFEEQAGSIKEARKRLHTVVTELAPRLLSAVAAAANFERRQGSIEAASTIYETLLEGEKHPKDADKASKLYPFVAMQYASFLQKSAGQVEKARNVLKEALGIAPHVRSLWEAAIHLEECAGGEGLLQRVSSLYECATSSPPEGITVQAMGDKEREELSNRNVEFADAHGSAADLAKAVAAHAALFHIPATLAASASAAADSATASRKRPADAPPISAYDSSKAPRTADGPGPSAAVAAAAPPAPPHPPAAYGAYPPAPAAYGAYPPAAYGAYPPAAYGYGHGYGGYSGYGY